VKAGLWVAAYRGDRFHALADAMRPSTRHCTQLEDAEGDVQLDGGLLNVYPAPVCLFIVE
jgi:hypothetical protein